MREQGFKLTPLAPCDNPACAAIVFVELAAVNPSGYCLCVECEDRHGARLRSAVAAGESARSRGHCTEDCCRRRVED
jgi:hypothetical protein